MNRQLFPAALLATALLLFACAGPTSTFAVVDPGPDGIGVYFDQEAETYCHPETSMPFIFAWVCLTNNTSVSGVSYWFARLEIEPVGAMMSYTVPNSHFSADFFPDIRGGYLTPLPQAPVLTVMELMIDTSTLPVTFRILPWGDPGDPDYLPYPLYATGDDPLILLPLFYSAGVDPDTGEPNVCAVLGGPCDVVETESATWGRVKTIFR